MDKNEAKSKYPGHVSCEVSGRYILFDKFVHENGLVLANVWSSNGKKDRKICDLVLKYDELVAAINNMHRIEEPYEMSSIEKARKLLPEIKEILNVVEVYLKSKKNKDENAYELRNIAVERMKKLNCEELLMLEAIMYIGRDDYINPDNYESSDLYHMDKQELRMNYNPEKSLESMIRYLTTLGKHDFDIIDNMLAKRPLATYLNQGLDILGLQRMSYSR